MWQHHNDDFFSLFFCFLHLSRQTAPRLKSSWVVFQPTLSDPGASTCDSKSYLSTRASVMAASASAGEMQSKSWPSNPRVRWKVSFREPALETTALKSCGRMEFTLGIDSVEPWRATRFELRASRGQIHKYGNKIDWKKKKHQCDVFFILV